MARFKVQALGGDNGSGEFERGGDLGFSEVEIASTFGYGQLAREIAANVYEMDSDGSFARDNIAGKVRLYDEAVSKVGNHHVVAFSLNGEGFGEQNFVFIATEVK